jgi:hypothetical protein
MKHLIIITLFSLLSHGQNNIIIGDSQSFYIAKNSCILSLIKPLTQPNIGITKLNEKLNKYPITNNVKSVTICIGVNDNYIDMGILKLMNLINLKFPYAIIYIIKGSWGWGNVKNITKNKILNYYNKFENLNAIIIKYPIGYGDPHKNKPIYKKIAKTLEENINTIK